MTFSFNSIATIKQPSNVKYLKPYTINDNVTIQKVETKEGTKKDGTPWKSLNITFGNDEGIYTDTIFYLDINDPQIQERKESDMPNGGKKLNPSTWERLNFKIAAILFAFAPDYVERFNKGTDKINTFDDYMKLFKGVLDKVTNKTKTSMKLNGRNSDGKIYATLPSCVGMAQANTEKKAKDNGVEVGAWYTWLTSPFGDNLTFSSYELQKKKELEEAKPTDMKDDELAKSVDGVSNETNEIDFDGLLS